MNLTLFFSRKYRWPEDYFSVWCLGNSQKLLTANQFLVSTIFFTIMNISFFNLGFDLFSVMVKEVNQIRKKSSLCFSSPSFRVLLCTHYGPLECFSTYFCKLKEIGVLRPVFPLLFLMTMFIRSFNKSFYIKQVFSTSISVFHDWLLTKFVFT